MSASGSVPQIFEEEAYVRRLMRAQMLGASTCLLDWALDDLNERLTPVLRSFSKCLLLSPPLPDLDLKLPFKGHITQAHCLPEGERYDLILSLFTLHILNDLPGMLLRLRQSLVPDGLFLAVVPGGETLTELRCCFQEAELSLEGGISPHIHPMLDLRDAGMLLQRAGFALPVVDHDKLTLRYDTPFHLLRDLRSMGATNILTSRSRRFLRRQTFMKMMDLYQERYCCDHRISATFDMVWLSGWSPHDSQPQPLKPGSAQISLKEVLKPRSS